MPTLQVDLREGFNDDSVVMRVDGREVYRRSGVRTNYSVGIADRIEIEVPAGKAQVELALPLRGISSLVVHRPGDPDTVTFALDPAGQLTGRHVEASSRDL